MAATELSFGNQSPKRIAVFASGTGTNLQALITASRERRLGDAVVSLVVSDRREAVALRRAEEAGIATLLAEPKTFATRAAFETRIAKALAEAAIDLIVLAGFMRILSGEFVARFSNRVINIHPSLLPSFPGKDAVGQALAHGARITGCTVHFVDEHVDHGPIIAQAALEIDPSLHKDALLSQLHSLEHRILVEAVRDLLTKRVTIDGRRVTLS